MVWTRKLLVLGTMGLMLALTLSSVAQAQRGQRGQRGGPQPGGPGMVGGMMRGGLGGGGGAGMLQREDVQRELRMTESQIEEVQQVVTQSREGMRDQIGRMANFRDMSEEDRREMFTEMQQTRQKQQEEMREKVKDILNRDQQARFAELEFQFALQRGDLPGALAAAGIELEERDQEQLREAQQEAQQELRAKMAELQRDANMEALETVVDRARLERLAGEPFEFQAEAGPGPFGRRGGDDPRARGRDSETRDRGVRGREAEERTDRRGRRPARQRDR